MRGIEPSPTFKVSLYELLRGIDRRTGGDEYQRIVEAFERLSGTLIRTTSGKVSVRSPKDFTGLSDMLHPPMIKDAQPVLSSRWLNCKGRLRSSLEQTAG